MMTFLAALALAVGAAASPDDALERLVIKDACAELLLTYGEGLDEVNPLKIWPLFTQDGVWVADGDPKAQSREELRRLWEGIAATPRPSVGRHAISNISFDVIDGSTAIGSAFITMYRYDPERLDAITSLAPSLLVEVDMRCEATEEGWRFGYMELTSVQVANYVHGEN